MISGTSPGRQAGRVRRAGPGAAPVLRGHPGAPGAQEPARPGRTRCSRAWSAARSPTLEADQLARRSSRGSLTLTKWCVRVDRRAVPAAAIFRVVTDQVTMPGGQGRRPRRRAPSRRGRGGGARRRRTGWCWSASTGTRSGSYLWELPAGLIDVDGRGRWPTAALRELAEEADLTAGRWSMLVDLSPRPASPTR